MADTSQDKPININSGERWASAIGGGALITYGLIRRSPVSLSLAALGAGLLYRGSTGHCAAYSALGVSTAGTDDAQAEAKPGSKDGKAPGVRHEKGIKVMRTVTIDKPADELYRFWREFSNLPKFMYHLEKVDVLDSKRSHWVAKAPFARTVEWNAAIINDKPGELIAWQTEAGADVDSAGSVTFKAGPQGRGTEVHVSLSYQPPAGQLGATVAKLFDEEPGQQIADDLRRFKQLMETGEVATAEGQSTGPISLKGKVLQAVEAKVS